jgi:hypothetical protein
MAVDHFAVHGIRRSIEARFQESNYLAGYLAFSGCRYRANIFSMGGVV